MTCDRNIFLSGDDNYNTDETIGNKWYKDRNLSENKIRKYRREMERKRSNRNNNLSVLCGNN